MPPVGDHDMTLAEVGDDEPIDEFKHGRMLEAIRSIDGKKRLMAAQRTEYAPVSEYSLSSKKKVQLNDLLGTFGKTAKLSKVRVKTKKYASKSIKTIPVPLEKLEATKIGRVVTYENVCKEVSKWDRVVFQNRAAEQVVYPLNQPDLRMETNREVVKRFKSVTPLEMEIAALLESRRAALPDSSPDERKARIHRVALDEALEMRRDMQIMRARQSYREAKARYQKKIKSKRYHRILKRERAKKEAKEFESLQKTNPELAQEKLEKLDRHRIVERMTLRHRNTGKWAREQIIKFKNDKESGRAVQEQIELGRHLTAKLHNASDSDDDNTKNDVLNADSADDHYLALSQSDASNPWMMATVPDPQFKLSANEDDARQELLVGFKKFWQADAKKRVLEANKGVTDGNTDLTDSAAMVDNRTDMLSTTNSTKPTKRLSWKVAPASSNDEQIPTKKPPDVKSGSAKPKNCASLIKAKKAKKKLETNGKVKKSKKLKSKTKIEDAFVCGDQDDEVHEVDRIFQDAAIKKKKNIENKKAKKKSKKEDRAGPVQSGHGLPNANDELISETLVRKRLWEDFDVKVDEAVPATFEREIMKPKPVSNEILKSDKASSSASGGNAEDVAIDPNKFISVKPRTIHCGVTDEALAYDDDAIDDHDKEQDRDEQRMSIAEAFADDDVVGEFRTEKLNTLEVNKLKDIDLTLPGWGDWGGKGLKISDQKRNRFTIKAPKCPPRKDHKLDHVIINETAENILKPLQVGTVPFPFRDADDFEKSLAVPIGKQWNSETAFRRLVAPKVITRMGTIIEPIDAEYLKNVGSAQSRTKRTREAAAKRNRLRDS